MSYKKKVSKRSVKTKSRKKSSRTIKKVKGGNIKKIQFNYKPEKEEQKDNFIYPLDIPLPNYNPHNDLLHYLKKILPWNWNKVEKDQEDWIVPRNIILNHIKNNILDEDGFLPEGTKLYHGSLDPNLVFNKDRYTFFGIDVVISLWYILEMYYTRIGVPVTDKLGIPIMDKIKKGYLYEFETVKPIKVNILNYIQSHPFGTKKCDNDNVCIHPQVTFRDLDMSPPVDLCIELTLNMKYYKDFVKLNKIYEVNPFVLHQNRKKTFKEFNPVESIILYD